MKPALEISFLKVAMAVVSVVMFASAASAGSLVEPMTEPIVEVVEDEDDGSAGILLPLAALILIGVAVSGGSASES